MFGKNELNMRRPHIYRKKSDAEQYDKYLDFYITSDKFKSIRKFLWISIYILRFYINHIKWPDEIINITFSTKYD